MGTIEIKELHIKINVDNAGKTNGLTSAKKAAANKEEIIAECIEQVMDIIDKRETER